MFLSTGGLCQHLSPSASALRPEKEVAFQILMWDRDEEGAARQGRPFKPLGAKGVGLIPGRVMFHISAEIKGRLRANDECHCLGFATVASSPPKQDGTQPTQRLKAWEITTRENFPFRSSRRPAG